MRRADRIAGRVMETTTRTRGSSDGYAERKCAHGRTRTRTRQNRNPQFDEAIISRYSPPVRIVIYAVAVLSVSGILPMALAALQTWLTDVYGNAAYALCMAAYAAVIALAMRHG